MKLSDVIEMYDALAGISAHEKLPGKMAYSIAKNISLLTPSYKALNDQKNEWLKSNATPGKEDGSYTLEGEQKVAFVKYMEPILNQEEALPEGIRKIKESDIPEGIQARLLIPLMGIIDEGECKCLETPKE